MISLRLKWTCLICTHLFSLPTFLCCYFCFDCFVDILVSAVFFRFWSTGREEIRIVRRRRCEPINLFRGRRRELGRNESGFASRGSFRRLIGRWQRRRSTVVGVSTIEIRLELPQSGPLFAVYRVQRRRRRYEPINLSRRETSTQISYPKGLAGMPPLTLMIPVNDLCNSGYNFLNIGSYN